ncbi:type II secretion system protein [Phragmitibacter flavus]|uniref:type II secretion system protein n=1 Tax=Phragmitibacter flavus TaxID=2576071 RepID=UPI0019809DA2|nr:prepilin-type N-terminal cleavage/methylation domain-containing protein [Phragmitibacter flavus]
MKLKLKQNQMNCPHNPSRGRRSGFTLIELLVVIGIIAILSSLGFAGTKVALQQAAKTREITAAKSLVGAYLTYPADNYGILLPGNDLTVGVIELPNGDAVHGPAAQRYPYRLAEFFDYVMEGTVLVNRNASQFDKNDHYLVSLYPALGMNHQFVGGSRSNGANPVSTSDCLTSLSQASSAPLVFASASNGEMGEEQVDGYCFLTPPNLTGTNWKDIEWTSASSAKDYGHVDARYGGKAVCAFLDGAVRLHSIEELRDMRLWSHMAAAQDNPDYRTKKASGGGRL